MGLDKRCKVQIEHNMKYAYANEVTTPVWIKCVSTFNIFSADSMLTGITHVVHVCVKALAK